MMNAKPSARHPQTLLTALSWMLIAGSVCTAQTAAAVTLNIDVDARELPRRLLHVRIDMPVKPGPNVFWYPKWIPGIHAPQGPVQNIAGLRFELPGGKRLDWHRDEQEWFRFLVDVPAPADRVVIHLDYICNQPSVNSIGVDSFGSSLIGVINWNTCLLYPDVPRCDQIPVNLRLRLPDDWRFASALHVDKTDKTEDGWIAFKPESLEDLIDSPLVAGHHFRSIDLSADDFPPVSLDLTSESPGALQLDDELIGHYKNLITEAKAMFGSAPFDEYRLLLTCSDDLRNMGLEHLASSLNGIGERDLIDKKKRKGWAAYLLPHEFVHAWCGKFRRPAGMVTHNFHDPKRTKLLWIYEGLTQYLGEVLTVRSGLLTKDEYIERLAYKTDYLMRQTGRQWRPLEDTAVASHILRGGSRNWGHLRRGQDYYNEGLLLWMDADALIRQKSDGQYSLDDFCQKFMGQVKSDEKILGYELSEVVDVLNGLVKYDWSAFINERVAQVQDALPLDLIGRIGYRLQYATEPSEYIERREKDRKLVFAADSIGLEIAESGKINNVVPDAPGDQAGLAPGTKVIGVNDRKFSTQRLKDAIADSVANRRIDLLVLEGDRFRNVTLNYAGGPKYLELVRDESKPDILDDILKPRAAPGG